MILEKFLRLFRSKLLITSFLVSLSYGALAQGPSVGLLLKQGKATYNLLEVDSIVIKAKRYKYIVTFPMNSQINLHHSYNDSLYQEFKTEQVKTIPDWWAHCMAEESYNSDKELLLSNDGWSCWFYDEKTNFHRLDAKSIRSQRAIIRGTKSVNWLYNVDRAEKQDIRAAHKSIYLIVAEEGISKDSIQYAHTCKIIFE